MLARPLPKLKLVPVMEPKAFVPLHVLLSESRVEEAKVQVEVEKV